MVPRKEEWMAKILDFMVLTASYVPTSQIYRYLAAYIYNYLIALAMLFQLLL